MAATRILPILLCLAALSACTPDSQTTHIMLPQDTPAVIPQIAVVDAVPAGAATIGPLSAASCSRKIGQPPPSADEALANLKITAAGKGATGLAGVTYKQGDVDYIKNCWATVTATGTAYRAPAG